MPYFVWKGIDLAGSIRRGRRFARNHEQLDKILFEEEIALLSYRLSRRWAYALPMNLHITLCQQMAWLLDSGLRLTEALDLVAKTIACPLASAILYDASRAVREGIPLPMVLSYHIPWIDGLLVSLVTAGHESGSLARTFKIISEHYCAQEDLVGKCRSALILPAITLCVFVMIAALIFVGVIPRFESLFVMINKPPPGITQTLFATSRWLRSESAAWTASLLTFMTVIGFSLWRTRITSRMRQAIFLSLPLTGTLMRLYQMTFFLQTLAVLLSGGVHLVAALAFARQTLPEGALSDALAKVEEEVQAGQPLSSACSRYPLVRSPELESLCALGEATGSLALMVHRLAELYNKKTYSLLHRIAVLIPPLALTGLGLIIGLLIIAVYAPLLTLSRVIG